MGKTRGGLLAIVMLASSILVPRQTQGAHAQSLPAAPCSAGGAPSPMPGHYTGPWHSDGDYHFAVFNTDLDLKIFIDGTLDVTIRSDGSASGTVTGSVDAPIYHDGIHDVSSGTGTITGVIAGRMDPSGGLVLSHPVIAMLWGTFIAGGTYKVPRSITMPDYQFPPASAGCVSARGSISEQNFPTQFIVADGASGLTQAAGVGSATGTWTLSSDKAALFSQLSAQVDAFISHSDSLLAPASAPLSLPAFKRQIVDPLHTLLATIDGNPDISRCLLDRIHAWEAALVPTQYAPVPSLVARQDLPSLRLAADFVRKALLLQADCSVADGGAADRVAAAQEADLDNAVARRDWANSALLVREIELFDGSSTAVSARLANDLHTAAMASTPAHALLDLARVAYAAGDDADALTALQRGNPGTTLSPRANPVGTKKHSKKAAVKPRKKKRTRRAKATPRPTATATPAATPTPVPLSLRDALARGVVAVSARSSGGAIPTFSWEAVSGARSYVVLVSLANDRTVLWSWSGDAAAARYGDVSLAGVAGSGDDAWPLAASSAFTWSVLALNASGEIVGVSLRNSS